MEKVTEISGSQMKTLAKLMESLRVMSDIQIVDGQVGQEIDEDTFIYADLTSLVGDTTLHLMNDRQQVKLLKAMNAGDEGVNIYAGEEDYHFIGSNFNIPVSCYEPLVDRESLPDILGRDILSVNFEAGSVERKTYKTLLEGKGPLRFDFDEDGVCSSIMNKHDGQFRPRSQKMIPTEQREDVAGDPILKLHSFWLHEMKGESLDLKIEMVNPGSNDLDTSQFDYWRASKEAGAVCEFWLTAEVEFASGVSFTLVEKLLPQLY
ncbi:hypothetical protein [Maridesulfovibrio sp.]|uniref:hypothetical protein n=1 Tax=Maridesulfovibrio sp. TaxID=2795000 RepID=UPI0039F01092